ncbi:VOC family protein [Actinomadura yumaensis]|uniref:VOC family protein n=1 Tax=Actinomadura yumaensis TaxID=111807 RepID=UPI00361C43ED
MAGDHLPAPGEPDGPGHAAAPRRGGGGFDHRRTGLDHLAFAVADRAELDAWAKRFAELGIAHSPVAETAFGPVLCFRDPDGVQLELFATVVPE